MTHGEKCIHNQILSHVIDFAKIFTFDTSDLYIHL